MNKAWASNVKTDCILCGKPISGYGLCNFCWSEWTCTGTCSPAWLYGTGTTQGLLSMQMAFDRNYASREQPISTLPIEIRRKI